MVDFARLLNQPPAPSPLVPTLVIGVTGHRPHKLHSAPGLSDGYEWGNPLRQWVRERVQAQTERLCALAAPGPCTCPSERHRDAACPLGKLVGDHPPGDSFRAHHLDSYLRRVKWNPPHEARRRPTCPLGVSGGALGVDQDACGVWRRVGVSYLVLVPFPGQDSVWPAQSRRVYESVRQHAAGVLLVSERAPASDQEARDMLGERNEALCCVADELIGVHDGSRGGTRDCLYRWSRGGSKRAHVIDPREFTTPHLFG